MMKNIILLLVLILGSSEFIHSQRVTLKTDQSGYPALDKLMRIKWEVLDERCQSGTVLIKNGVVFIPGANNYALDALLGKKYYFENKLDQVELRKMLNDSLLAVYTDPVDNSNAYLINIFNGNKILGGSSYGMSYISKSPVILDDSIFFFPRSENDYVCKNIKKPRHILWQFKTEASNEYSFMKHDSSFIFFEKEKILFLNRLTGSINWNIQPGNISKWRILDKNRLYYMTYTEKNENIIWSLDIQSRKTIWKTEIINRPNRLFVIKNDTMYYITEKALIYLDCRTGKIIKEIPGWFRPMEISVFNKYIMVRDKELDYYAIYTVYERKTGKIKYRYFTSEGFPPYTEEDAKKIHDVNDPDWDQGVGSNILDQISMDFVEDPKTGLLYAKTSGTLICFELIEN